MMFKKKIGMAVALALLTTGLVAAVASIQTQQVSAAADNKNCVTHQDGSTGCNETGNFGNVNGGFGNHYTLDPQGVPTSFSGGFGTQGGGAGGHCTYVAGEADCVGSIAP
jgi:hypothetical protein